MNELTAVSAEQGQTLRDIVRRVYNVHEHERVVQISMIISVATPNNRSAFRQNLHVALREGTVVDLLPWAKVEKELQASQSVRQAALGHVSNAAPSKGPLKLVAPKGHSVATMKSPLERDVVKALLTGSPPANAAPEELGSTVARAMPFDALQSLLQSSASVVQQNVRLYLMALKVSALEEALPKVLGALNDALQLRFRQAVADEYTRRLVAVQTLLGSLTPEPLPEPLSAEFPQPTVEAVLAALGHAITEAPESQLTPSIKAETLEQWHARAENPVVVRCAALAVDAETPLNRFIDAWRADSADGSVAHWLYLKAFPIRDRELQLCQRMQPLLPALDATLTPYAAFNKAFPELLRTWRAHRVSLPVGDQEDQLAEERRLLTGRNFLAFRKELAPALEGALARDSSLPFRARVVALVSLLASVGHQMSNVRIEQLVATLEGFMRTAIKT